MSYMKYIQNKRDVNKKRTGKTSPFRSVYVIEMQRATVAERFFQFRPETYRVA